MRIISDVGKSGGRYTGRVVIPQRAITEVGQPFRVIRGAYGTDKVQELDYGVSPDNSGPPDGRLALTEREVILSQGGEVLAL